ncbi:carboxylesterase family protein [Arthrobacter sp. H14]|uniref:carboxylesterase family protein n=1 Tax=Arthrobacter sp. H14 TaxID=1312959 RepID=UPI0004B9EA64
MPASTDGPTFAPPCGPVQGWVDGGVIRATGIPYATADRFQEPVPAPDRSELFAATSWSPACPQNETRLTEYMLGGGPESLQQDENCQRLSITMPAGTRAGERLPVLVWIHGGSYVAGAGDMPLTDSVRLVTEQHVVVVSITYRLGLFGYLGGDGRPANLGLLDQAEAFRWVLRNIDAFGGDGGNVTAFGQSAGGDAILHLLAAAKGERLFHKAIVQSAPLGIARGRQRMTAAMLRATQDLDPALPAAAVLELERNVIRAGARHGLRSTMPFGIQYGHPPLPDEAEVEAAWDAAVDVPLLIGTTANETRFFVPAVPLLHAVSRVPLVGKALIAAMTGILSRIVYGAGADRFAGRHARGGGSAHRYTITWSAPGNRFGSPHTIDLPLLLGDEDVWRDAPLLGGATWKQVDEAGKAVRSVG